MRALARIGRVAGGDVLALVCGILEKETSRHAERLESHAFLPVFREVWSCVSSQPTVCVLGAHTECNQMCDALCSLGGPLWEEVVVSRSEKLLTQWVDPFARTTVLRVIIACITAAGGYVWPRAVMLLRFLLRPELCWRK